MDAGISSEEPTRVGVTASARHSLIIR
jgi:hypothetical protein